MAGQQVRQPVGGLLHLVVGHRAALTADRHRLRGTGHLRSEQRWNRHRRRGGLGQHRPITRPHPGGHAQPHPAHRSTTPAAPDQRSSPPAPAPTARSAPAMLAASNTSVRNSTAPADPGGLSGLGEAFGQRQRQVHAGGVGIRRQRGDLQIPQPPQRRGLIVGSARPTSPAPAGDGPRSGSG